MKYILDKLIVSLSNGDVLIPIIIAAVAVVFKYKKIVEFIDERQKARIAKLTDAIKCEFITGLTKSHLEEEIATEHFKLATGIRLERVLREAVIQAHQDTKGELGFAHFKRALPHIFYRDSKLVVEILPSATVGYWFNLIFGLALALLGLLVMTLPSQIKGINIMQVLSMLSMGALYIAFAFFELWQTLPVFSARKISKELEKDRNNSLKPAVD